MSGTTTINSTYSTGVSLTTPYTTITETGTVTTSSGNAIHGNSAQTYTVRNSGFISGYQDGIYLAGAPGSVTNTAGGFIAGGPTAGGTGGVMLEAGGSVTNQLGGTISGYNGVLAANSAATVVNAGVIASDDILVTTTSGAYTYIRFPGQAAGVLLQAGGVITNQAGGTISGYDGVKAGAAATVVNAGVIAGTVGIGAYSSYTFSYAPRLAAGVALDAGGSITNQSGGTISGYDGIIASNDPVTVVNAGIVAGAYTSSYGNADGIYLKAGGSVTNQATGDISGHNDGILVYSASGTVVNLGTIHSKLNSSYGGEGVVLDAGGVIVNGGPGGTVSAAYIGGYNGGIIFGATGTDTLVNYGTVSGNLGFVGASLLTGTVINGASGMTGGLIKSGLQNNAVVIGGVGTVANYGIIAGRAANGEGHVSYGVSVGGSGTVASSISNLGPDALIYGYVAVYASQNATVTNGGTLEATQTFGGNAPLDAVIFGGGTNRLIIDPGAVFIGNVVGSGPATVVPGGYVTVLGTANGIGTTTMELASAASAGTLSGLGTKYAGFAAVTIDPGARWTFSGSNTLAAGVTLTDSGTLTSSGTLINAGLITGAAKGVLLTAGARVTNQSGGTITGSSTGISAGGVATLVNSGLISGNPTTAGDSGIYLAAGGLVTNQSGGTISAYYGIWSKNAATTVVNAGSIAGNPAINHGSFAGAGIELTSGGHITNQSGGTISGYYGIKAKGATMTVVNAGAITGYGSNSPSAGVFLSLTGSGSVTNQSGGVISGKYGINDVGNVLTVVNAGTIIGTSDAVKLVAGVANRLVIDPGAVFSGAVTGGNTIGAAHVSTLELASAGSAGTLSGLGTQFVDFGQVTLDAGARWTLQATNTIAAGVTLTDAGTLTNAGNIAGSGKILIGLGATVIDTGTVASTDTIAFAGTSGVLDLTPAGFSAVIGNFQTGDVISLTGVSNVVSYSVVNGNTLDLVRSDSSHIDLTLNRSITNFTTMVSGSNTLIRTNTPACFAAGTALATPDGPVAVESLCIDDMVLTASGQVRPVRWIGRRHLDLTRHPKPGTVQPIRIMAGALGDGLPNRDLLVSPDHAMLLDGMLIPARLLRNDVTIRREENWASVTYYHVELETHDVLLAEGAEAESYLDTGNRDTFENAGRPMTLHPDLEGGQSRREAQSCAPFAADAERVEPVWRRLARRAPLLGLELPEPIETTADPDLRVECGGRSFAPVAIEGARHTFLLPAWQGVLRLRSRYAAPSDAKPWIEDQRQLGVMIRAMTVTGDNDTRTITVDNPALQAGWWDVEQDDGSLWRWTDGNAAVAVGSATPCRLEIDVADTTDYAVPASATCYRRDFSRRAAA